MRETGRLVGSVLMISWLLLALASQAAACAGCWVGYGSGDERFNKPLADIRIVYEKNGRGALPYIRDTLKTSTDPLVLRRAANYIVELRDEDSLPLMEDMILMLVKRVSFGKFGLDTYEFQGRLAVAHALAKFGSTDEIADRVWAKYERLDVKRKDEVPYILNGLGDPELTERLLAILDREEDHQLMVGALTVLGIGGSPEAVPALRSKLEEWQGKGSDNPDPEAPVIYYTPLRIKAQQAISQIEERGGTSVAKRGQRRS